MPQRDHISVAIVGGGISGIAQGIRLKEALGKRVTITVSSLALDALTVDHREGWLTGRHLESFYLARGGRGCADPSLQSVLGLEARLEPRVRDATRSSGILGGIDRPLW